MQNLSVKSLVAAVAAAGLIGAVAPAAVAGPPADKPGHAAKADREAAREAAKADRADARVDRLLARVAQSKKLAGLGDDVEELVRTNIEADVALDEAGLRPSTYRQIINQLHFAERLLEAAAIAADADATTAVQTVVDELGTFTAATEKAELRRTKRSLQEWAHLVEDDTDADEDETELEEETEVSEPEVPDTETDDSATV